MRPTRLVLSLIVLILLTACTYATVPTIEADTQTSIPISTPTLSLPQTEITSEPQTADSPTVIPTEAGPKNGNIKTVTENGRDYRYVYNAEAGQWTREVAKFPLWDGTVYGYVIYTIAAYENVLGERSVYTVTHQDVVSDNDHSPFHDTFKVELEKRFFGIDRPSNEQSATFQKEMIKGSESTATIPIIVGNGTPKGQILNVKLGTDSGINVTIMDPATIHALGGENVIKLNNGTVTFYVQAYGVDIKGNALYRLAFEGSMNNISDKALQEILFMIPGNLIDHVDQRELGFTPNAQVFANWSIKPRANGEPDFSLDRVPLP